MKQVMEKVTLETATGELLHQGEMPIVRPCPKVLVWNGRYFVFDLRLSNDSPVYREVSGYTLPDEEKGDKV